MCVCVCSGAIGLWRTGKVKMISRKRLSAELCCREQSIQKIQKQQNHPKRFNRLLIHSKNTKIPSTVVGWGLGMVCWVSLGGFLTKMNSKAK